MLDLRHRTFVAPDQTIELPLLKADVVELGDFTVGFILHEPGWRWSEHMRPNVDGGEWCQARHVGVILSGRAGIQLADGRTFEFGPHDLLDIPPGHDAWVVGEERMVMLEWVGLHTWAGPATRTRGLAAILFTDLVESTATAARLGDRAWRELVSGHFGATRSALDRFGGREIQTTGDGLLATFDTPADALRAADAIRGAAARDGLALRAGVHVGEIELTGGSIRGIAVHEAARIMASAAGGEIFVSETARVLAEPSGLRFEDRGPHELKGLEGERRLYAYLAGR